MQMHALGASVKEIQNGILSKYGSVYPTSTPTPTAP